MLNETKMIKKSKKGAQRCPALLRHLISYLEMLKMRTPFGNAFI